MELDQGAEDPPTTSSRPLAAVQEFLDQEALRAFEDDLGSLSPCCLLVVRETRHVVEDQVKERLGAELLLIWPSVAHPAVVVVGLKDVRRLYEVSRRLFRAPLATHRDWSDHSLDRGCLGSSSANQQAQLVRVHAPGAQRGCNVRRVVLGVACGLPPALQFVQDAVAHQSPLTQTAPLTLGSFPKLHHFARLPRAKTSRYGPGSSPSIRS